MSQKKIIFTFIVLFLPFVVFSQTVLGDFETDGVVPEFSIEENALTKLEITDNPLKNELNNTDRVLYAKTADAEAPWWAGMVVELNEAVTVNDDTRYLHVLVKTDLPKFEFVIFNHDNTEERWMGQFAPITTEWFDHVIDISSLQGNFSKFRIALHMSNATQQNKELWIDEIILNNSPAARTLPGSNVHNISIDAAQKHQVIKGFAASDCWTGNYVGQYWNDTPKNTIAKYLFSQNYKTDGSPEGIGLSMWRVNLGAGTLEQGANSDIDDISRRAECFLDASGNYDWTKQIGQQWFMQKAKEYGCESFVLFSNSPLTIYTRNGKGYAPGDGNVNLQADKFDDFADYLATVAHHFVEEGYNITHISPVNEPQYDWKAGSDGKAGQEGSPWKTADIKKLVVELDKAIQAKGINTKILIPEAGSWENLYKYHSRAGYQIREFFSPLSLNYVGDLPSVAQTIGAHSYWTETNNNNMRTIRTSVKNNAEQRNIDVFQTEWSLLSETGEGFPGLANFSYMDVALYMAKVIHADLAYANVTSWSFWTSMDMERWGHKNRFLLVALSPGGGAYNPITQTGTVADKANLWALGNYSFFIRPGYQRIQLNGADDLGSLMGTAYMSPDKSKIVSVYVNMTYENKTIKTSIQNTENLVPVTNKVYITTSVYKLKKHGSTASEAYEPDKEIIIPSRSVVTIVYEMDEVANVEGIKKSNQEVRIYPNPVKSNSKINIDIPWSEPFSVHVYQMNGSLIYSKNIDSLNQTSIDLPPYLKSGVYILKLKSNSEVYSQSLIVN
ncbi:MAG: glycoside hydrolase [Paludibacter sp.]|jgi:O-glycosyl hydrolase